MRVPDALQLGLGREVDRVQHLGPVDGDPRDVVVDSSQSRPLTLAQALVGESCRARARTSVGVLAEARRRAAQADRRARHAGSGCRPSARSSGRSSGLPSASRCAASAGRPAPRAGTAPARRAGPAPRAVPASASRVLLAKRSRNMRLQLGLVLACSVHRGRSARRARDRRAPSAAQMSRSGFALKAPTSTSGAVSRLEDSGERHRRPVELRVRLMNIAASCICIASIES